MYSFKSKVRYSEADREGKLKISAIVDYFQDCSTFQSEYLNVGVEYLKSKRKAWLLNSWQIEFIGDAVLLDDIEIGTWSYGANGAYGYRNFVLNDGAGRRLVNANSLWVLTDTDSGRPIRVEPEDVEMYGREPQIEMTDYGRKIKPEGDGQSRAAFDVRKYHIDTNGHVNNARYIQFAMEYLEDDVRVKALRAEYRKAAVYGDTVYPVIYADDSRLTVALNDAGGANFAKVQFIY